MEVTTKQSFGLHTRILRVIGLYSPEKPTLLFKVRAYFMLFLFTILIPFLIFLHLKLEGDNDKMQKNLNAVYLAQVSSFAAKLLPFIIRGEDVKKCVNYFEAPFFAVHTDEQKKIVDDVIWICRRNGQIFSIAIIACALSWIIRPLFLEDCIFPVYIWLPFNATADPKIYISIYLFLAIGISYACLSGIVDPLLGGLPYQVTGQLKILKNNLQHLSDVEEGIVEDEKNATKFEITYWKIRHCIRHHTSILNFVKLYERCFSLTLFTQLATSVVLICFLCQRLGMMKKLNLNTVVYLFFIGIVLGQIYFYCYYGTIMSEESDSLTTAIYMCNWYEFDIKSRRALIILMELSQRPLVFTAGTVVDLSLQTFTTILRRSYSLIAVLKNF